MLVRRRAILMATLLASCTVAHEADADEAPADTLPSEPIEVTVRGSKELDTFASTRAASTTTSDDIREAHADSLADALRGRPGVSVQQTTPGQGTIYVRGLSGRAVVHLVDGVRINSAIFRAGNNPYLGLVDPMAMEAIEVVRGASSDIHGSDALGGVVSMVTRLPRYTLEGHRTELGAYQSMTSNPLGAHTRVDGSYADEQQAVHLGVSYLRSSDIRPGAGQRLPDPSTYPGLEREPGEPYRPRIVSVQPQTAYEMFAADLGARRRLTGSSEIILRAQLTHRPELARVDEMNPLFKREYPERATSRLAPFNRTMVSATFLYRPTRSFIDKVLVMLAWQRLAETNERRDMRERCLAPPQGEASGDECTGRRRLEAESTTKRERNRSDSLTARGELQAARADRTLGALAGAELLHDMVSSTAEIEDLATSTMTPAQGRFPNGSSMTQGAFFARAEATIAERLRLHVGGRASTFLVDIAARPLPEATAGHQFRGMDASATTGASLELATGVRLVANAGRGVRAPNVEDFAGVGSRAGGRQQIANPDLSPEHSMSVDAGLKTKTSRLHAEVYAFALRYEDAIVLAPVASEAPAEGTRIVRSENATHVDYTGTEGEINLTIVEPVGAYVRWLAMLGTQTNAPHLGGPPTTPADRVPPAQGTLGAWLSPDAHLRFEVFAQCRAAQRRLNDPINIDDSRIPDGGTPGFVTFHARATYRPSKAVAARLALDNLTNERVLEHGSGFYRPGFGATASLELRWN